MSIPNQSYTKCPKCGHSNFELVEDYPTNSNFKMWYMRCATITCHTFLQAMPYLDTNKQIDKLQVEVNKIKTKVGAF